MKSTNFVKKVSLTLIFTLFGSTELENTIDTTSADKYSWNHRELVTAYGTTEATAAHKAVSTTSFLDWFRVIDFAFFH